MCQPKHHIHACAADVAFVHAVQRATIHAGAAKQPEPAQFVHYAAQYAEPVDAQSQHAGFAEPVDAQSQHADARQPSARLGAGGR